MHLIYFLNFFLNLALKNNLPTLSKFEDFQGLCSAYHGKNTQEVKAVLRFTKYYVAVVVVGEGGEVPP